MRIRRIAFPQECAWHRRREKIWDQAAGAILIEEAGGRVTDMHGEPLDFGCGRTLARNAGIIASNGHLHEAVIEALRPRGGVMS